MAQKEQRGRLGRGLAIGIYSIALAYLVIVGFASVIPQVFWPPADESFDLDCDEGLQLLQSELEHLRILYLSTHSTDPKPLRRALATWDGQLNELAGRCDEDRVHLLNRYRHRVELLLERFMREDAPLAKRVEQALESTGKTGETETAP